eukprot:576935-Pyramimonas_sp.AAC.2
MPPSRQPHNSTRFHPSGSTGGIAPQTTRLLIGPRSPAVATRPRQRLATCRLGGVYLPTGHHKVATPSIGFPLFFESASARLVR